MNTTTAKSKNSVTPTVLHVWQEIWENWPLLVRVVPLGKTPEVVALIFTLKTFFHSSIYPQSL
jgi:hypothetical protein